MRKNEILEVQWFTESKYDIVEENGVKKYLVSAPFTRVDYPNGNNRVYPRKVMQDAINKLRPRVINKEITMMVDHPDWQASLRNTGALLVDISDVDENGFAWYTAQIADTAAGKDLKALVDLGAKLGVSTRGYGACAYDQEIPGFPGKFDVIQDGFELETIDFVDDPSVKDTKTYVQYESKSRSKSMKTVEELKAAFPELMEQFKQSVVEELNSETETKVEEAKASVKSELEPVIKNLAESLKTVCPDLFTVIPEVKIQEEKEKELESVKKELEDTKKALDESKVAIKESEKKVISEAKDAAIEALKAKHEEFFKLEVFANIFEHCETKEDVESVFNKQFKVYSALKESMNSVKEPKSQLPDAQIESVTVLENGLTEAQNSDFERKNKQRTSNGLEPLTIDSYKSINGI